MSTVSTQLRSFAPSTTRLRVAWARLLVLTTLATLATVLTYPFSAQEGEFVHALRSGEISSVAVGHPADFTTTVGYSYTDFSSSSWNDADTIAVSWVNRFGFRRSAVLTDLRALQVKAANGSSTPAPDPSPSIVATARRLGVAPPTLVKPGDLPLDWTRWLSPWVWLVIS